MQERRRLQEAPNDEPAPEEPPANDGSSEPAPEGEPAPEEPPASDGSSEPAPEGEPEPAPEPPKTKLKITLAPEDQIGLPTNTDIQLIFAPKWSYPDLPTDHPLVWQHLVKTITFTPPLSEVAPTALLTALPRDTIAIGETLLLEASLTTGEAQF